MIDLHDTPTTTRTRFWEIDFLRGCAIILMVGFHWTVDRYFIKGAQPKLSPLVLSLWQMVTAGLFLLLAGVSLTLHRDPPEMSPTPHHLWQCLNFRRRRILRRGMVILGWGLLITAVTRFFSPKDYIIFGILQLIGMAVFISQPLLNLKIWNLALGVIIIVIGVYLNYQRVTFPWLLWAGFIPENFTSIDYFPIFPWYGAVLIGIFLGNTLYSNQGRNFPLKEPTRWKAVQWLCFLGRNSLLIYIIHQPIILLILFILR